VDINFGVVPRGVDVDICFFDARRGAAAGWWRWGRHASANFITLGSKIRMDFNRTEIAKRTMINVSMMGNDFLVDRGSADNWGRGRRRW
jgi:hypothetical protein